MNILPPLNFSIIQDRGLLKQQYPDAEEKVPSLYASQDLSISNKNHYNKKTAVKTQTVFNTTNAFSALSENTPPTTPTTPSTPASAAANMFDSLKLLSSPSSRSVLSFKTTDTAEKLSLAVIDKGKAELHKRVEAFKKNIPLFSNDVAAFCEKLSHFVEVAQDDELKASQQGLAKEIKEKFLPALANYAGENKPELILSAFLATEKLAIKQNDLFQALDKAINDKRGDSIKGILKLKDQKVDDLILLAKNFTGADAPQAYNGLFYALSDVIQEKIAECNVKQLNAIASAFSKRPFAYPHLFSDLKNQVKTIVKNGEKFELDDLIIIINTLSKRDGDNYIGKFFLYLSPYLKELIQANLCDSSQLISIASSFSTIDVDSEALFWTAKEKQDFLDIFNDIRNEFLEKKGYLLNTCSTQNLIDLSIAFSRQKCDLKGIGTAIIKNSKFLAEFSKAISKYSSHNLVRFLNTLIDNSNEFTANAQHEKLFLNIIAALKADFFRKNEKAKDRISDCDTKDVDRLLKPLCQTIKELNQKREFDAADLVSDIFRPLLEQKINNTKNFTEFALQCHLEDQASLLDTLSQADIRYDAPFLNFLNYYSKENSLNGFYPKDLISISNGLARVTTCLNKAQLAPLFSKILEKLKNTSDQDFQNIPTTSLVNALRSFTLIDLVGNDKNYPSFVERALKQIYHPNQLILNQLYQIKLALDGKILQQTAWQEASLNSLNNLLSEFVKTIPDLVSCNDKKDHAVGELFTVQESKFQQEVTEKFQKRYGENNCKKEVSIKGLPPVDIYLPKENNGTCIEVNGPCHYIEGPNEALILDFRSTIKQRLLQTQNHPVVIVEYSQWKDEKRPGNSLLNKQYITKLMESAKKAPTPQPQRDFDEKKTASQ